VASSLNPPQLLRFSRATSDDMTLFSSSLDVDMRMLDEDVDGSIAHATMLGEVGILTQDEARTLTSGLEQVREEIRSGAWTPGDVHEDVHMAVEARLTEVVGEVGKKIHTARSRNDQVATDVRLWLKRRLVEVDAALVECITALLDRIESDGEVLIPGFTHLQRGQPILLGHHLLAHTWPLVRDRERFQQALARLDFCPLGACAMAGTPHPIDRQRTAELLGFSGPLDNAMDAVAARDHEQEVAATCAIAMTHLSRMAEELVIFSTSEFGLVRLGDEYTTGSSIMPQKRNPDAAELVRGKVARVYGDLVTLLTLVKAQSMAYNRDLQEDREALFDAVETTAASLRITAGMWRTLEVRRDRYEEELQGDTSLATELADLLAERGVTFRDAHEVVGEIVQWCEERGENLLAVTPEVARSFHDKFPEDLSPWLDPRAAAERRTSLGGTAPSEIKRQVLELRRRLG
jgi:argininosuccinate lyase